MDGTEGAMKAIQKKMTTIGRGSSSSNSNSSGSSSSGSGTNTRPPLPTARGKRGKEQQQPPPPPAPAPAPKEEEEQEQQQEGVGGLTVEVPAEQGGVNGSGGSGSSDSSYFIFSPSPQLEGQGAAAGAGAAAGGIGKLLAGVAFGPEGREEEGGVGGAGAGTGVATAQASLGIAERIAGFLSLGDLAAYFGVDELGGGKNKSSYAAAAVRRGADRLLGSLSLLRLVEWGLGAVAYTGRAYAMVVVTTLEFARGGVAGIVAPVRGWWG